MAVNPQVREFIEKAKANGATEQTLVGILVARGWPEKEVYVALAAHYEELAGIQIPARASTATAAKDAFFYLLTFSTLATWTIGLGSLAFSLIDSWFRDPLFRGSYTVGSEASSIATAMASILVAYPIYLLVTRIVIRDVEIHPEKLNSPVRKWLTYMALVLAAVVFVCDLVTALTYLLRGETTSRFLAKAFTVLVISAGVFFYYYFGQRRSEETRSSSGNLRDLMMASGSAAVVLVMVVLGFVQIGGPGKQRLLRADQTRVEDLYRLTDKIQYSWRDHGNTLPRNFDEIPGFDVDPVTRAPYIYNVTGGSRYELCATFAMPSDHASPTTNSNEWSHPAGLHCFPLDAAKPVANPFIYLGD